MQHQRQPLGCSVQRMQRIVDSCAVMAGHDGQSRTAVSVCRSRSMLDPPPAAQEHWPLEQSKPLDMTAALHACMQASSADPQMVLAAHLQLPQPHNALASPEVAHTGEEQQLCDGPPLCGLRSEHSEGVEGMMGWEPCKAGPAHARAAQMLSTAHASSPDRRGCSACPCSTCRPCGRWARSPGCSHCAPRGGC